KSEQEPDRRPEDLTDDGGWLTLNGGRETRPLSRHGDAAHLLAAEYTMDNPSGAANHSRSGLLCSMLAEMKQHSFEAEISLMIMRYASELAARGILFMIKDAKLCGLGQFGLNNGTDGTSGDKMVSELCIPLETDGVFARVIRTGE